MISVTATDLHRLMHCFGSYYMPRAVPVDADREARDKGNAEHWIAEQMFAGSGPHRAGVQAPNGYIVTQEMIDAVTTYVSALDCGQMEVDTSWSNGAWEVRGRADHLVYREKCVEPVDVYDIHHPSVLTIDDYKSGHRIVEPYMNWTLIWHAIGYVLRNQVQPEIITLRIHQPRPYHPNGTLREWSFTYEQLLGFYAQIDARLSNPVNELLTGLDHCAKCHALALCPAARQASMNAIDATTLAFDDSLPKDVLTFELETLRQAQSAIDNRAKALEELISYRIKTGEVFQGWALERRLGQRRWKPGMTGRFLSIAAGVDLSKDDLVTPAEAERRGMSKQAIEALVDRPLLDPKLKRIDADAAGRAAFGVPE